MAYVATKAKFHVALDGQGLILQGAPNAPVYKSNNAPVYGTRFASGDRDYNDLSQWWYLIETDWSGGFKDSISFEDDAKFYYSSNIDAYSQIGSLRLEQSVALKFNNSAGSEEVLDVVSGIAGGTRYSIFIDADRARKLSDGTVFSASNGDIRKQLFYKDYYWRIVGGVAATPHVDTYDGTTNSDKVSQIDAVIDGSIDVPYAAAIAGGALYVFGISTTDKLFIVKTLVANPASSADWSLVSETATDDSTKIVAADTLGTSILYLTHANSVFTLYHLDVATGISTVLREFNGETGGIEYYGGRMIKTFGDKILVTIVADPDTGKGEVYAYDGSDLSLIYTTDQKKYALGNEAVGFLTGGCVVADNRAYWGNLVYDGTSFQNFIKTVDDDNTYVALPIGYDPSENELYIVDTEVISGDSRTIIYAYDIGRATGYKTGASNSAFLVFSQHDKLQSIDKLLNSVTIGFDKFVSGQSIAIYYTTNPSPSPGISAGGWTLLGTASHTLDGTSVTSKVFPFPVGTTAKKVWFRAELVGGGSNTPSLNDFTLEYLPMPDYKKEWMLSINLGDEVKRLDGALVETTGRELKARLEKAWWTKSQLDFQDLDYATTLVNDASFDATETTVTVISTYDFPEQGRIRVDDEEILYTGKTPTTFTGCTRGARGTRASTHAQSSVVNNAYRVIIVNIETRVPILLQDKDIEYTMGISLRET